MADPLQWLNAKITLTIPLDTSPGAPAADKQEAVAEQMEWIAERFADQPDVVMHGEWEVVTDA